MNTDTNYNYDIVKRFTLATTFWGIIGITAGVFIALQMVFRLLQQRLCIVLMSGANRELWRSESVLEMFRG